MKNLTLFVLLFLFFACQAQESKLLVDQRLFNDLSKFPIYPRLVEDKAGEKVWKEAFKYLDDIEISGITYISDGLKVNGFLVKPKKPGKYPCIIYNRGGNREFGSLVIANGVINLGQIAKEGYVVIASQYRGNVRSEGKEEFGGKDVNDVVALTKVLAEVESADTSKIGMYGWSRGGMMTYLALTKTDKIKVAAVGGAVSDLTVIDRPAMEEKVYAELIPDYWANKEVALKERSILHQVEKLPATVPILMLHGNADWRVKPEQSLTLALAFEQHRIPYRLIMFEGGDHGISEHKKEVHQQVINWFDKYLKQEADLPNMKYHGR